VLLETELADEMRHERTLLSGAFAASSTTAPEPDEEVARRSTTLVGLGDARANADHPLAMPDDDADESVVIAPEIAARWSTPGEPYAPRHALVPSPAPRAIRGAHVLALLSFGAVVLGAGALWHTIEQATPRPPASVEPASVTRQKSDAPMCKGVARFTPDPRSLSSYRVDTRTDASADATRRIDLGHWRNRGAPHAPTALVEIVVPGTGPHTVAFSTINADTDRNFDTLVAVFPSPCGEVLGSQDFTVFDDVFEGSPDKRTKGSVLSMGGSVLTFVLTAYGGGGPLDEGPIRLDVLVLPAERPDLTPMFGGT
jgi:hypothetical protein